mmetsp:Transcript_12069/g.22591  ORF Transcript_12069/g.22591 Transcript_12069/m.22591 type:complete len:706 (+) Transcript_12069:140-2257(+)
MTGNGSNANDDLKVIISASGRADLGSINGTSGVVSRLIHAVTIQQPLQSWTVIRDHIDFITLGNALSTVIVGIPQCPSAPVFTRPSKSTEMAEILKVRDEAQVWLTNVLLLPGARESPTVRQFLCYGANTVPAQYQGIQWITPQHHLVSGAGVQLQSQQQKQAIHTPRGDDELEMDDMFGYDDGLGGDHDGNGHDDDDDEDDDYDEDAEYFNATERYQPTMEPVTHDDMMDMNNAEDVEMIEDVGSFAQSMGASHLGRSLQLQAEMARYKQQQQQQQQQHTANVASIPPRQQQGLKIGAEANVSTSPSITCQGGIGPSTMNGGSGGGGTVGGIGNAVENSIMQQKEAAVQGLSDSFYQKSPVSAPRLDSFKLIKVVGKGSFGKVFLVREIKTQEMFALKVLRKDNIIKRNQVEHTRTERSVLGYVNHPFIVGLKMAFQSKEKLFFVLDYCAGGELFFHLCKVGKFSESRASFYAAEIVLALEYIHQLDIVYRDLKPENVLLDARGHVRLTDFGLSKEGITNSSSGANSFCGTPEYLAPEILNRQGHGRAVDWWSLGALLYEMLTGLPPFYCRDRERLFEKIRRGHLEYPRSLSSRAQMLLRGLLTKDPTKRLGSGEDDASPIKSHLFFQGTNWEKLASGEISPPWDPQINNSADTSQFDEEFTSMPIFSPSSHQPTGFGVTPQDNVFEGFTFTNNRFHGPLGSGN